MRILLTGVGGQLGRELQPMLAGRGELLATARTSPAGVLEPAERLDLAEPGPLLALLDRWQPQLIVNAAAYTAVDRAEQEAELAMAVNARAPEMMAGWAARHDCALLHFSTDYVFDGRPGHPWRESDPVNPLNVYGASKLQGEQAIRASACRQLVLRSSWIYAAHGHNFVLKMLELARSGRELSVVGDQLGSPTWAKNLAACALQAIDRGHLRRPGEGATLYHWADRGAVSWFDFAERIFAHAVELGLLQNRPSMRKVDSREFRQAARRPAWSVLDSSALQADLGIEPAGLESSLLACLKEIKNNEQHHS